MKKVIILNSLIAESIVSAVIMKMAHADAHVVDIESGDMNLDALAEKDEVVDVYPMVDYLSDPKAKGLNIHELKAMKKKAKNYRRRLILLFEEQFEGKTRPRAVHLIGGYQLADEDFVKAESFAYAVTALLWDLNDAQVMFQWKELFGGDNKLLDLYVQKGEAIKAYAERNGSNQDIDEILLANEEMSDEVLRLGTELEEALKNNASPSRFTEKELLSMLSPGNIKKNYKVSELKAFCKEEGLKGYTKLNEDDLIKFVKKAIKG